MPVPDRTPELAAAAAAAVNAGRGRPHLTTLADFARRDYSDNVKDSEVLTPEQESSAVLVNFTDVSCFEMTFANMRHEYLQEGCLTEDGTPGFVKNETTGRWYCPEENVVANYPWLSAEEGGNPLNSSLELNPENFNLGSGECPWDSSGRNWVVTGLSAIGDRRPICHYPPPPPPPSTPVTAHDDPIFTVGRKNNATHVYLPNGALTRLLRWTLPGGRTMELLGKTFHQVEKGSITDNEVRTYCPSPARAPGRPPPHILA